MLDTLAYLKHETEVWFEITTLLIPGENDSPAEVEALSRWVMEHLGADVPLHFTAFHPDWKMLDTPPTPPATLAHGAPHRAGRRACVTSTPATSTIRRARAPIATACDALLIGRDWYDLTAWTLTPDGRCRACGAACAGVFEGAPGRWGRRRQAVNVPALAGHGVGEPTQLAWNEATGGGGFAAQKQTPDFAALNPSKNTCCRWSQPPNR